MMAVLILVCSVATLLMFFVSYCLSLTAASAKQPISQEVADVTGIRAAASGDDFARVVQLLELCPEHPDDRREIRAINAYFGMLGVVHDTIARLVPPLRVWTEVERGHCTHFAAIALDRRIAFNRSLLEQQINS
jgi:hypothetical protein